MGKEVITPEELLEQGASEKDVDFLERLMTEMATASNVIKDNEKIFKDAKLTLVTLMENMGIQGVRIEGIGNASYTRGSERKTYSDLNIRKALADAGIPVVKIGRIMKKAVTITQVQPGITFRAERTE